MKKWGFCLTFCLLLCATAGEVPTLGVETTVTATMKATTAYVAFLVRGQGLLISDAQKACDAKITAVSEEIKKRFKDARIDTTTVNTGTKDFQGWRASGLQIEPDVTQLVTVTLPPDETLAAEILDIAIRKGHPLLFRQDRIARCGLLRRRQYGSSGRTTVSGSRRQIAEKGGTACQLNGTQGGSSPGHSQLHGPEFLQHGQISGDSVHSACSSVFQ